MGLYMLNIEKDFSWDVMETIGSLSCLHFLDANKKVAPHDRTYYNLVRRCEQAFNRIHFIGNMCNQYIGPLVPPRNSVMFADTLQKELASKGKNAMTYFEEIEQILMDAEKFLTTQRKKSEETYDRFTQYIEQKYVLQKAADVVISRAK